MPKGAEVCTVLMPPLDTKKAVTLEMFAKIK